MNRQPHPFQADPGVTDWRGTALCTCGMPRTNRVHKLPEVPKDVTDAEARRLGEHNREAE